MVCFVVILPLTPKVVRWVENRVDNGITKLSWAYNRVAVGMGICGNSHGKPHRFPYGMGMGMTLAMGIPTCGNLWDYRWDSV